MNENFIFTHNIKQMATDIIAKLSTSASSKESIQATVKSFLPTAANVVKEITGNDILKGVKIENKSDLIALCKTIIGLLSTDSQETKFFETNNSLIYHNFLDALASQDFVTGDSWPTADLSAKNNSVRAVAQLKPPSDLEPYLKDDDLASWKDNMSQKVLNLSDLTADVLDIITYKWLHHAVNPESMVTITADDFLRFRGLQPKMGGGGRRGGYYEEQRREIANQIVILDNTYVTVMEMEVTELVNTGTKVKKKRVKWRGESKALIVESRLGPVNDNGNIAAFAWQVRPGGVFAKFLFGPGRQTALLSQKAIEYDYYKQKIEKRLARYFAWQWRNRQNNMSYFQPFTVETLLNAARKTVDVNNPSKTYERLEKALDTLQADGVIAHWQYESSDDSFIGKKGWVKAWLTWRVLIEPPQTIIDQYAKIKKFSPVASVEVPSLTESNESFSGAALKAYRTRRNLTLSQAAEEIDFISASRLSRIERGDPTSDETICKLIKWMNQQ